MNKDEINNVHLDPANNPEEKTYKIPLGICKQAVMKLGSAMTDVLEIKEDPDISEEHKYAMEGCAEIIGQVMAVISNIVSEEMDEDEFLAEIIEMDELDEVLEDSESYDIMNEEIP